MSLLSKVTKGRIEKPFLLLIHGAPGVGKSTFCADAPNPIFLGTEDGTANLDCARFPAISKFADAQQAVRELAESKHDFKTLVIDSLDWLEPMVFAQVCSDSQSESIESALGGYGKGYVAALDKWRGFIAQLGGLRDRGMNVLVIAHSQVKKIDDAVENKAWDRVTLKLNEKASGLWQEFVDCILYATYQVHTKADQNKTRAYSDGSRVLLTEWRPTFVAKNRYGLPFELPLSWDSFADAVKAGKPEDPAVLKRQITEMLSSLPDKKMAETVRAHMEKLGDDSVALAKVVNRLTTLATK
jgi:hypothetical protein